jgi:hypothetical protein
MAVQLPPAGGPEPHGLGKEVERLVGFEEVGDALVPAAAAPGIGARPNDPSPAPYRSASHPPGKVGRPPWA